MVGVGLLFFVAGTVGLLRFPDPHSRLHALTKADNLGLGFVAIGLALHAPGPWQAFKLLLVWALALLAAATAAQLVARSALVSPQDEEDPAP
nr:monovalent cation/H(+) antiporter subunit G [Ramlibacter aurantiacus]